MIAAGGREIGHLATGKSSKGTVVYFVPASRRDSAPGTREVVLWGLDRVGELYLVSVTIDGRLLRVYWYTPGLFGAHAMITQVNTGTGETVSRRAPTEPWTAAVKALRKAP